MDEKRRESLRVIAEQLAGLQDIDRADIRITPLPVLTLIANEEGCLRIAVESLRAIEQPTDPTTSEVRGVDLDSLFQRSDFVPELRVARTEDVDRFVEQAPAVRVGWGAALLFFVMIVVGVCALIGFITFILLIWNL